MTLEELEAENARLRRWLRMTIEDRIVEHLSTLVREHEGQARILRPPSYVRLAEIVGACREHVTRTMHKLIRSGLIVRRSRSGLGAVALVLSPALVERARLIVRGGAS